jgi:hypothetical protein
MNDLKDLPEAKYVMDDLMRRTLASEDKLINQKKKSLELVQSIIKDVSILQIQITGIYSMDREQVRKKEKAMDNLVKLIELNL